MRRLLDLGKGYFLRVVYLIILILFPSFKSMAQSDPTLTAMIIAYTDKSERQLKSQERVMLLQTTGHIWTREEMEATTDFQKQFNEYLDSFRSVITYASQIYGLYFEIDKITENMSLLSNQMSASPGNSVAVALTPNRNTLYRELMLKGLEMVNDIRKVCLSDIKMTEKERAEIIFGIRPKIREMNKLIRRLILAVKYTSLADVWHEIDNRAKNYEVDKTKISTAAFNRWRNNGKKIKPHHDIREEIIATDSISSKELLIWENGLQYYVPGNI